LDAEWLAFSGKINFIIRDDNVIIEPNDNKGNFFVNDRLWGISRSVLFRSFPVLFSCRETVHVLAAALILTCRLCLAGRSPCRGIDLFRVQSTTPSGPVWPAGKSKTIELIR
jgi:hypothetical protein